MNRLSVVFQNRGERDAWRVSLYGLLVQREAIKSFRYRLRRHAHLSWPKFATL